MSYEIIEAPCLGRAFRPGMLYDCRKDLLVPALTLWNPGKLKSELNSQPLPYTNCELILEDSTSEKTSKLGVDANLKLSLLGGLVSVSGAASFLNDRKKSSNQARVSLKYSTFSRFEELTMAHLGPGDIQHPEIFDSDNATHVVVGVLYGADAVFVFDQEASSSEEVTKITGNLQASVSWFTGSISGGANLNVEEKQKESFNKIRCTFYGDVQLKRSPVNFIDAMDVYCDLPSLIKEHGTVPKKVWLYPLAKLDKKAARLVRQISAALTLQTELLLEEFNKIEVLTNDVIRLCHPMVDGLKAQVELFQRLVGEFKNNFQKQLLPVLPRIRGGGADEAVLAQILENVQRTFFCPAFLRKWLQRKRSEINSIEVVVSQLRKANDLENVRIAFNQTEADQELLNFTYDAVVGLVFDAGTNTDKFLQELETSLHNSETVCNDRVAAILDLCGVTSSNIRKISKDFIDFARMNAEMKNIKFLVYAEKRKAGHQEYPRIVLHDFLKGTTVNFVLPSAPGKPTFGNRRKDKENSDTVQVEWTRSEQGFKDIVSYKLEYIPSTENLDWTNKTTFDTNNSDTRAVVRGLDNETNYVFRVRALTHGGMSCFSETSDLEQWVKILNFCGRKWMVRNGDIWKNKSRRSKRKRMIFNNDNVYVDTKGRLHLSVGVSNKTRATEDSSSSSDCESDSDDDSDSITSAPAYQIAHIMTAENLGFGRYELQVEQRFDGPGVSAVLGSYRDPYPPLGVRFPPAKGLNLNDTSVILNGENKKCSFNISPSVRGRKVQSYSFTNPSASPFSVHCYELRGNDIVFTTVNGADSKEDANSSNVTTKWSSMSENPANIPQDRLPVVIALYMHESSFRTYFLEKELPFEEMEIVIHSFKFTPY